MREREHKARRVDSQKKFEKGRTSGLDIMKRSNTLLSGRAFIARISCVHGCKVLVVIANTCVLLAQSLIDC